MFAVVLSILQISRLANPVFTVNSTTEAAEVLSNLVNIIFAHFCNLVKANNAETMEGLLN
jgi:hypothetical protein